MADNNIFDQEFCADCGCFIRDGEADGLSSLYSPDQGFRLCEPCWLDEDAEIEKAGTNDIPERVARYAHAVANNYGFD